MSTTDLNDQAAEAVTQTEPNGIREQMAASIVEEEPAPQTEEETPKAEEEATPTEDKTTEPDDGLPHGIRKRFAKMTAEKHALKDELADMRMRLQNFEDANKPKETPVSKDQFESEEEYVETLVQKQTEKKLAEMAQQQQQQQEWQTQQQSMQDAWMAKVEGQKEFMPDWEETVESSDVILDRDSAIMVHESPLGPRVLHHLMKNPGEVESLKTMSVPGKNRYLTRLEMTLEQVKAPTAEAPEVSKAPKPTPKPRGKSKGSVSDEDLSMKDWMKRRNKKRHGR